MPFVRKRSPLFLSDEEIETLRKIRDSRTESYAHVTRARILLAYYNEESINGIAKREGVSRSTVEDVWTKHWEEDWIQPSMIYHVLVVLLK